MQQYRHVFISYSRKDTFYANTIAAYLMSLGYDVWIDKLMGPGEFFPKEIEKAIKSCAVFMPLLSPHSKDSKWVLNEVLYARHMEKPHIPIWIGGEPWLTYMTINHVDLSKLDLTDLSPEKPEDIEEARIRLERYITPEFKARLKDHLASTASQGELLTSQDITLTQEQAAISEWQDLSRVRDQLGSLSPDEAIRHSLKLIADLVSLYDEASYANIHPDNVRYELDDYPIVEWMNTQEGDSQDRRRDVIGLGQLLYFMLSPSTVAFGDTDQHIETYRPDLDPALQRIINASIRGDFPTPQDFRLRLEIFHAKAGLRQALDHSLSTGERLFSVDEAVQQAVRLCNQLEEDHKNGIAHHKLNTENIVIQHTLQERTVRWIESAIRNPDAEPKQAEIADDVYMVGSILYEMLTGYAPAHDVDDSDGKLRFSNASVWVRIGLDHIIYKTLAEAPVDRYRNLVILRERLNDYLRELAFAREIDTLIAARYPLLYINTWEEERIFRLLSRITMLDEGRKAFGWTISQGVFDHEGKQQAVVPPDDPMAILDYISESDIKNNHIYILYDFHPYLKQPQLAYVRRRFRDLVTQTKYLGRHPTIIISPIVEVPPECEKDITILHHWLPRVGELAEILDDVIQQLNGSDYAVSLNNDEYESLVRSARGLTTREASRAFWHAVMGKIQSSAPLEKVDNKGIVLDSSAVELVLAEKERVIKVSRAIQIYSTPEDFGDLGGLDVLKTWLAARGAGFSIKAKDFGLPAPKGLLLVGVPGCGKSLAAKAIASEWHQPLLRLDAGALFSSRVGSSEQNLREALAVAEAMAPAVLWIDEIEKAFAGVSQARDSGVSARIFGALITWLQEKSEPVFVVATANNIGADGGKGGLPPELLRRGRFDEIFFVDLPTPQEREQIFEVHLQKRGIDTQRFDFGRLAENSEGFSGAEIEQVVISTMYEAFAGSDIARQEAQAVLDNEEILETFNEFSYEELMAAMQSLLIDDFSGEVSEASQSPAAHALKRVIEQSSYVAERLEKAREEFDQTVRERNLTVNLDEAALLRGLQEVVPLAVVMNTELNRIRKWAKDRRLRFASSPIPSAPSNPSRTGPQIWRKMD